jgi:hypothetical protein
MASKSKELLGTIADELLDAIADVARRKRAKERALLKHLLREILMPTSLLDTMFHEFKCANPHCGELFEHTYRRLQVADQVICPKCEEAIDIREAKRSGVIGSWFKTIQALEQAGKKAANVRRDLGVWSSSIVARHDSPLAGRRYHRHRAGLQFLAKGDTDAVRRSGVYGSFATMARVIPA